MMYVHPTSRQSNSLPESRQVEVMLTVVSYRSRDHRRSLSQTSYANISSDILQRSSSSFPLLLTLRTTLQNSASGSKGKAKLQQGGRRETTGGGSYVMSASGQGDTQPLRTVGKHGVRSGYSLPLATTTGSTRCSRTPEAHA